MTTPSPSQNQRPSRMIVVFNGVVHPWLCDAFEHLTVRHYLAMFDEGEYHLHFRSFGLAPNDPAWSRYVFVSARHELDYKQELRVGDLIEIKAGILSLGGRSIQTYGEMTNPLNGSLAATFTARSVFFDLETRKSAPFPDDIRRTAQAWMDGA